MADQITVKVFIRTNKVGSECRDSFEVDREEWESMTDEDKDEMARDAAFNYLDWGYEVEE